jgi:hypothetical protein
MMHSASCTAVTDLLSSRQNGRAAYGARTLLGLPWSIRLYRAWHAAPFAGKAVAATFQHETDAAVNTLRRQAMG